MSQTQLYAGRRPGRPARSLAPLIAAAAVGCCVSACGSGTATTASGTPASSRQPASPGTASGSGAPAGQNGGQAAVRPATPGAALAYWIHQVADGNRRAACQDTTEQGLSAQRFMALCMSGAAAAEFNGLHKNFVADGIGPSTPITVAATHVNGTLATVSGSHVQVSGTTLDSLMAAHSTGVKPGQLDISFDFSRVGGAWYVTSWNMNV